MTLTPKQIEDALSKEEWESWNRAQNWCATLDPTMNMAGQRLINSLESLAECRIENKRLKKAIKVAFQTGREAGFDAAVKIVRETKPEGGGRG